MNITEFYKCFDRKAEKEGFDAYDGYASGEYVEIYHDSVVGYRIKLKDWFTLDTEDATAMIDELEKAVGIVNYANELLDKVTG